MSETAQTIIKAALRAINAIATGETPTNAEMAEAFESMKFLLRSWSANNILIYSISQDTLTMTGATSYTIGSGGDVDTTWPYEIKGAVVDTIYKLRIVGEDRYRSLKRSSLSSKPAFLYYNPVYPLGVLYPWPTGGSSMVIDSLKALSDPATLTTDVEFPTGYDEAIKWNLAKRLAPEYGKPVSRDIYDLAKDSKDIIESKNAAMQLNAAMVDLKHFDRTGAGNYNIDGDVSV